MAAQDVGELAPRVRRALEGPVPVVGGLTDGQLTAVAADAIADLILLTAGEWGHSLAQGPPDSTGNPTFTVDPKLSLQEQSLVAMQAALTHFFHTMRDVKVAERIKNEGQEWEFSRSANAVRDWIKLLTDQRDAALAALQRQNPVMARVASILAVRDAVASAYIEPWLSGGGVGGGQLLYP